MGTKKPARNPLINNHLFDHVITKSSFVKSYSNTTTLNNQIKIPTPEAKPAV